MLYWVIQAWGWEIVRKVNICPRRSRGQMRDFEDNLEAEAVSVRSSACDMSWTFLTSPTKHDIWLVLIHKGDSHHVKVSWAALWKITFTTGSTGSFRTRRRTKIVYFQKYCLIESNNRQSDHSHCSRQRPRRSVWRAEMKATAMKLANSEIRSQICRSNVKIPVKWFIQNTTLTSLLDYLALNSSWQIVTGNADCRRMIPSKWHRRRKVFFWRWQKPAQNGWSFGLFSCCSNVCIQNFVHLFELTVSDNGEGFAVGRRQVSIQTTSLILPSLYSMNSNRHSRFWLPHKNFLGFQRVPTARIPPTLWQFFSCLQAM